MADYIDCMEQLRRDGRPTGFLGEARDCIRRPVGTPDLVHDALERAGGGARGEEFHKWDEDPAGNADAEDRDLGEEIQLDENVMTTVGADGDVRKVELEHMFPLLVGSSGGVGRRALSLEARHGLIGGGDGIEGGLLEEIEALDVRARDAWDGLVAACVIIPIPICFACDRKSLLSNGRVEERRCTGYISVCELFTFGWAQLALSLVNFVLEKIFCSKWISSLNNEQSLSKGVFGSA